MARRREPSKPKGPSLWELLASIPDPREAQGRRYSLPALLTLTTVALFGGAGGPSAIAQFAADRGPGFAAALGFTKGRTPCSATLHYLFKRLDLAAFEKAVRRWVLERFGDAGGTISIDGKMLRGTRGHATTAAAPGEEKEKGKGKGKGEGKAATAGTLLVTAYAHKVRAALAQVAVGDSTNEHKTALQLLNLIPLEGKAVIGDAMFCQRDLSRKITKAKGDYLWAVKKNQPELHEAIDTALDPKNEKDFSPS